MDSSLPTFLYISSTVFFAIKRLVNFFFMSLTFNTFKYTFTGLWTAVSDFGVSEA